MMRRWHHGHSFGIGALGGASIFVAHPWLLFVGGMVVGAMLAFALVFASTIARWLRGKLA